MNSTNLRLRTAPMIALVGALMVGSLFAAAPAAAAKIHPFVYVFCEWAYQATPGTVLQCRAFVDGSAGTGTGTLKLSASSYKGTLSTKVCSSLSNCQFTYTPKGKGSDYRQDTVTAIYSGDDNYYGGRSSYKFPIVAPPPAYLGLICPTSIPSGTPADCYMAMDLNGPTQFGNVVTLKVPTYKGNLSRTECATSQSFCVFTFTPKGTGTTRRVDTITASYAGDQYNSPTKATVEIKVTAAP